MKKIVFSIAMLLCPLLSFSQINYQLNIDKSDMKISLIYIIKHTKKYLTKLT